MNLRLTCAAASLAAAFAVAPAVYAALPTAPSLSLIHILDLPGVDPKAVEITSDHGVLTIRGRREELRREAGETRRIERINGEFQRRFSLPESADVQNIKAKAVNGVLEVSIPKLAQVQPHRITVEAA